MEKKTWQKMEKWKKQGFGGMVCCQNPFLFGMILTFVGSMVWLGLQVEEINK